MKTRVKRPNPFPFSDSNKRYHTYDYYLRHKYGKKCVTVPLDGGFSCPNIDGTISYGGKNYVVDATFERFRMAVAHFVLHEAAEIFVHRRA